jgi:hypothetical protein
MISTIRSLIVLAGCGVIACLSSWRAVVEDEGRWPAEAGGDDEGRGPAEAGGEGGSESGAARSSAPRMIRMPV